jgi:hypothetical protein
VLITGYKSLKCSNFEISGNENNKSKYIFEEIKIRLNSENVYYLRGSGSFIVLFLIWKVDNIKMDPNIIGCRYWDRSQLAQDTSRWQDVGNKAENFWFLKKDFSSHLF